ncbi:MULTISPECIES: hypothetical protein [Gordonibacter]|uniref:Chemotaxis protein CheW n=1 Tax=Gordonibacter faecis TaxID=3047475 RepID=A0ABT7DJS8_9ACTN|nr:MULTISPECIES: hypothetical protein [unclassified Gordonibacter]MDJ1649784.1 hypothetical protein [Gordonibacter sp. KGMB12511]HIW75449.1 chemotaxis protein CheW [Candidatus Gordonibacter avicola]
MRDNERRLAWIESLIGARPNLVPRSNVVTVSSDHGPLALPFAFIEEIVPGSSLRPFAFLPAWFCGTVARGVDLYPVLNLGGAPQARTSIALVSHDERACGFRFSGAPQVVDLDTVGAVTNLAEGEIPLPFPLSASKRFEGPAGPTLLLDVPATLRALCEA